MVPRDPCLCGTTHVRQSWSVCLKEYSRREYMSLPRSAYSTMASIWDPFPFPRRSLAPGKASCHVWGHLQAYREPHLTMWELRSLADSQPRTEGWRYVSDSWSRRALHQICRWLQPKLTARLQPQERPRNRVTQRSHSHIPEFCKLRWEAFCFPFLSCLIWGPPVVVWQHCVYKSYQTREKDIWHFISL